MSKWRVWIPEEGETEEGAVEMCALDSEDAAEKYVECRYDSEEYKRLARDGVLVHVIGCDKILTHVRVYAEAVIEFYGEIEKEVVQRG